MHSLFKVSFIILLLLIPAAVVYASDASATMQSALASADVAALELSINTPVKFSQQIVKGTLPEWQRLAPTYASPSPLPVSGQSMYYNPGVMQKVITYRQKLHQIEPCEDCIGYVALLRAGDINRKIWLQVSEDTVEGPFLVTDVAARHDIPRLLRIGWGIDVDWETAKRWNLRMPMVTIWDTPPAGMIINSTAAWRSALAATARQFNELLPWVPIQPAPKSPTLVVNEVPMVEVKPRELSVNNVTMPALQQKGVVVNNILFKQGALQIQMERAN